MRELKKTNYFNMSWFRNMPVFLFFLASIIVYFYLALTLLHGPDFGDETEKLVGALMISKGGHLYRDIFSHHGPLAFMLAQGFYLISGSTNIALYRIIALIFSAFSIASIFFSPILHTKRSRFLSSGLMALGLSANQAIFGLMLGLYQVYAGHLLVCALALFILPVLFDSPVRRFSAFLGGFALALVFFAGYSFVLSCVFLFGVCAYKAFLSKSRKINVAWLWSRNAMIGIFLALLIVLIWLIRYGDLLGYIVYHFYFNQVVYTKFSGFGVFTIFIWMVPILNYFYITHFSNAYSAWMDCSIFFCIIFYTAIIGCLQFKKHSSFKTFPAVVLLFLGLLYSDPRGAVGFQADTIVIVGLGLMALVVSYTIEIDPKYLVRKLKTVMLITTILIFIIFIVCQFCAKTYLYESNPIGYYKLKGNLKRSDDPIMQFIRTIVGPDERLMALPLTPLFYINADRLPASGNYYYLPWQDAYFKKPLWNYKIDICRDIKEHNPKIIFLDSQIKIWGIDTSTYLGCVQKILASNYVRTMMMKDLWIRKDILLTNEEVFNTAIISENFNVGEFPLNFQRRINTKKIVFKKLISANNGLCVLKPKMDRGVIKTGSCNDLSVLKLGMYRIDHNQRKIVTSPNYECIEITDALTTAKAKIRIWPCMLSALNQNFDAIHESSGLKLRAKHSNFCLTTDDNNLLIQEQCSRATAWYWG